MIFGCDDGCEDGYEDGCEDGCEDAFINTNVVEYSMEPIIILERRYFDF